MLKNITKAIIISVSIYPKLKANYNKNPHIPINKEIKNTLHTPKKGVN